ncbi:MAG: GntR family transcriptional regulator / MocR family aminotransferase [Nocardioidaceae bacterium]|jgi:GntR family transcriptional regulator/MocR family aminotransferase|nr:GntR family transcriptional regulator / MocR family aminotransferase [Nocardioidaceae bacterium]
MGELRTNSGAADLLVEIRRDLRIPLHRQIESSIRRGVRSGRLRLGTALPSTRGLAVDLGVSRGVVVEAYEQLVAEGYLTSRPGGYTQVAIGPEPDAGPAPQVPAAAPTIDFRYGRGDASHFPRTAWLRSVRRVLLDTPSDRFGALTGRGAHELHAALADYLNRARGTSAQPANLVICNGFAQGIALLLQVLAESGARRVVVEDPSSVEDARQIAVSAGLDVVGVPVGPDGIEVSALRGIDADAVILTPAHQWPTGAVLSPEARSAILHWAEKRQALVIEDDYDAEYRYDRAPIGAMQGVAPHLVVYAGTASKTLAPGLRLGWLVLPATLVDRVARAKLAADRGSAILDQLTFADFLARGEFDRHLRRMRPIYRRRRDTLLDALGGRLPDFRPTGVSAGFHLVTWLPPDLGEEPVVEAAAERGVGVYGIAPFRGTHPGGQGLIFGYAGLDEETIVTGVDILAEVVADLRHRPT